MNVVVRALPLTCTTDLGTKFVPIAEIVNAGPPAVTVDGVIAPNPGTGGGVVTFNATPFDVHTPPRHAGGLTTVSVRAVPAVVTSLARIPTTNAVEFTNPVVRAIPSTCTTDPSWNPVPLTISGNPALPAATLLGVIVVIVGVGLITWKFITALCACTVFVMLTHRNTYEPGAIVRPGVGNVSVPVVGEPVGT